MEEKKYKGKAMEPAERMQPVDLLKIYGNIEFDWNLRTDAIEWIGPFDRLFSPDIPLSSGSSFNNLLSPESFTIRMSALDEGRLGKDHSYICQYLIELPNHEKTCLREEGRISYDKAGAPLSISGSIRFIDNHTISDSQETGYDEWTGFPTKEILFENLISLLEQSHRSGMPGAYLAISVYRLSYWTS